MLVTYYKTERRNFYTGETTFLVTAKEHTLHTKNGLLQCSGTIPAYEQGTPLEIEGKYIGECFHVSSCKLYPKDRMHAELVLRHITDKLTEIQIEKILEISECNLFDFILRLDAKEQLLKIFKATKKPGHLVNIVYEGIRRLKDNELYAVMFVKYQMPLDAIEGLMKNKVSFEDYKKSPYLLGEKHHIPIRNTDEFAFKECGIDEYSPVRLCGYVYSCMLKNLENGNTCIPFGSLLKNVNYILEHHSYKSTQIGAGLLNMCVTALSQYLCYMVINGSTYIYVNHVKKEEDSIIANIKRLQQNKQEIPMEKTIQEIEQELGITYNKGQREAFNLLKTSGVKILTGPPGSGKTAFIEGAIRGTSIKEIDLSATTGMAAKVMSDASNRNAQTVHKLIEYVPYGDTEKCRDMNNPLDSKFIIVDEVSMLGVGLCSLLLNAIKNNSILLFVGDEDQLESVEYGNVLHDLIASGMIEVYRLTEIIRQSGTICENAQNVNKGIPQLRQDTTFQIFECQDEEMAKRLLLRHYNPQAGQILSPIRKGDLGTLGIHELLEDTNKPVIMSYGRKDFREGDKIVMTANNYNHGYINGDIGYVQGVCNGRLKLRFGYKNIELSHSDLMDVEFADAVTVHKSQGSEYEVVYIVLPENAKCMMSRRILYTGITRAKKKVLIYSIGNAINTAIISPHQHERRTMLSERLKISAKM